MEMNVLQNSEPNTDTAGAVAGDDGWNDRRRDFPALSQEIHDHPLVYLDNAATTQKPEAVLQAIDRYYRYDNANVHRGVHTLSERATETYERARKRVATFLGTSQTSSIVFVRGCTEAINLVASSYGQRFIGQGDEILLTELEHHSNIVPWQLLAERVGAKLQVAPIDHRGVVDLEEFEKLLGKRTRLVAISHVSNALGTINPVTRMVELAHQAGALALVDGAQAAPHMPIDVEQIACDFYAISAHKMYGPTGIGALYARPELLEAMPPYQGGGDMIRKVRFEGSEYAAAPQKFEAGTPNIAGAAGWSAAIDYLSDLGMEKICAHEKKLLKLGSDLLEGVPGLRLIGTAPAKAGVLSFVLDGVHPHDLGTILDHQGIAIRTGHHCAMPVMCHFNIPATARASLGLYNSAEEMEKLASALKSAYEVFAR